MVCGSCPKIQHFRICHRIDDCCHRYVHAGICSQYPVCIPRKQRRCHRKRHRFKHLQHIGHLRHYLAVSACCPDKNKHQVGYSHGNIASIVLLIMTSDVFLGDGTIDMIGRGEGILLLFCFAGFMTYSFLTAKNIPETEMPENASTKKKNG